MSLNKYINFDKISASSNKVLARVIPDNVLKSISYNEGIIENFSIQDCVFDVHLYNQNNDYINSLYNQDILFDPEYSDFYYNISKSFFTNNINSGYLKSCFNFYLNVFGNHISKYLFLEQSSPDETELKLTLKPNKIEKNPSLINQFKEFDRLTSLLKSLSRVNNLVVNFGGNNSETIVNIKVDCEEDNCVYVKLLNPISSNIQVNDSCYISFKVCEDYVDSFLISPLEVEVKPNELRGPNFDVPFELEGGDSTAFRSWDSLVDAGANTTNDVLLKVLSGSDSIPLNIDYTDFSNFVFYGSAEERVKNYDYKRRLIEYYKNQSISSSATGSFHGNKFNIDIDNKINNILSTFDPFESWLQEESGSLFTHDVTGSITPSPKYVSSSKYVLYHTTSSEYQNWYNSLLQDASEYDESNLNRLYEYTPGHIVNDSNNDQYILFLDMIGHYFDNLYSYIKKLTSIHEKDESTKRGIPNELLKYYAESLGWDIRNGYQISDLWLYKLGQNRSGSYDDLDDLPSLAHEDLSHQVWRRIVNNLPSLLKTKGTSRSIKALMSSYGIPKTLISIKEYGGPPVEGFKSYKEEKVFNYALNMDGDRYIESPTPTGSKTSNSFEFRFRTDYSSSVSMSLWSIEDSNNRDNVFHNLELVSYMSESTSSYSGSYNYGKLKYTGTFVSSSSYYTSSVETDYLPIFDNDFWDVQIKTDKLLSPIQGDSNIILTVQKSSDYTYNRISFSSSAEWIPGGDINYTMGSDDSHYVIIGGSTGSLLSSNNSDRFRGDIQFYKEYSSIISSSVFEEHTFNPHSYSSNDYSSSYLDLTKYFPLGGDVIRFDHSTNTIITSSHPNRDSIEYYQYATLYNFSGSQSDQYNVNSEVVYTRMPRAGANVEKNNKVRIESYSTKGHHLSPDKRMEKSSHERSSTDSNRLVIAYAPSDQINKDIYNQFGYFSLDNYLGDPKDQEKPFYSDLGLFADSYWKKYSSRNNYNDYIKIFSLFDFSFFDHIKKLSPYRANLISGVLVDNTIIDRPRVERKNPSIYYNNISTKITPSPAKTFGKYTLYTSSLLVEKEVDIEDNTYTGSIFSKKEIDIEDNNYTASISSSKNVFILDNLYTSSLDIERELYIKENNYTSSLYLDYFAVESGNTVLYHSDLQTQKDFSLSDNLIGLNLDVKSHLNNSSSLNYQKDSIKLCRGVSSNIVGVDNIYEDVSYYYKINGVNTLYNRKYIKTNKYNIFINQYKDNPYLYTKEENKLGTINNINYPEFLEGIFTGSVEVTSSVLGITESLNNKQFTNFINKFKYVIDPQGYFYRTKNNGNVITVVDEYVYSDVYKLKKLHFSSSADYDSNYIYNNVSTAVSMSFNNYYSSSLENYNYQYQDNSVFNRIRYEGSILEGPDININTTNTPDGGPVVVIREVNNDDIRV